MESRGAVTVRTLQSLLGGPAAAKQYDIQSQWVIFSIDIRSGLVNEI